MYAVATGLCTAAALTALVLLLLPPAHRYPRPQRPRSEGPEWLVRNTARARRTRWILAGSLMVGALLWLITGWLIAIVIVPAAAIGLPALFTGPKEADTIERLEAMEEWTRSLAGVLTVGIGLEEAISTSLRSVPEPIRDEVGRLAARLRARWPSEDAIRAFADDLDDATGDLIAASLILGAHRRGAGLADVLTGLAETVAEDVHSRRKLEADRAKPRAEARWVTIASTAALGLLTLTGTYIEPYSTPLGQLILLVLLTCYVGALVWMRRAATTTPLPRFIHRRATTGSKQATGQAVQA